MEPWLEQFEARRKARESTDRTFTLLGEKLAVKASVAPELSLQLSGMQRRLIEDVAALETEGQPPAVKPDRPEVTTQEMLDTSEAVIRGCLTTESLPGWERLRNPDAPEPLSLLEIYGLADFVLSKVVALPTGGPSGSSAGQPTTKPRSKAKSSSTAATPTS